jgi:hypothetical protein
VESTTAAMESTTAAMEPSTATTAMKTPTAAMTTTVLGKGWVSGECESKSNECGDCQRGSKLEFTHNLHLSSGWGGLFSEEPRARTARFLNSILTLCVWLRG